ncbi:MAG: discoidin domain-containing protein [Acidobacteriota bacterium]
MISSLERPAFPSHLILASWILTALIAASTASAQPCDRTVTATRGGVAGTTPQMAADGNSGTAFRSSYSNWQFLQLAFDCEIELTAIRRMMTRNGSSTSGQRSWQGEQVSYSLDGQTFHHITPAASSGWESYVAYHPRAWHSVEYGWSRWLVPNQPVRARWVRFHWDGDSDYLHEVEVDARAVIETTDLRLTQSGMVTTAIPTQPLVAGKTTLLRATVIRGVSGGPGRADEAFLDVIRESPGSGPGTITATVRGVAIASDNRSLRNAINASDHVHFFIPGRRLEDEASYRFRLRLVTGGQSHTTTVLTGIATRENAGVPVLFTDYNEGLFASLGDLFRFTDAVIHTSRMLPIKDTNGELLRHGVPTTGARGLRYEYVRQLPLATPGALGPYIQDFVLDDFIQGTGNNAANQNCAANVPRALVAGRVFAYNFTFPEDLDGDGQFSLVELAQCRNIPFTNTTPMGLRINNFGNRIRTDIAQRKASTQLSGREFPTYGLQLVPHGPTRHLRGGWLGNAGPTAGWAGVSMTGNAFPTLAHELLHELGRPHSPTTSLPGPAYDLKRKRRVPNPFDLMAGGFPGNQDFFNSFVNDADWNLLLSVIPRASGLPEPPPAGSPTLRVSGIVDPQGTVHILRNRVLPAASEHEHLSQDMTLALLDADDNILATGPAKVTEVGTADWPKELDAPLDLDLHGEVEWTDKAAFLAVLDAAGAERGRTEISKSAPTVTILNVDSDDASITVTWKGVDEDGDLLTYDLSLVYPDGRQVLAAAEVEGSQAVLAGDHLPGGEDITLRIEATDGIRSGVDETSRLFLANRAPTLVILAPVDGESFEAGARVALIAAAQDPELADVDIAWSSDRDGDLGSGDELTLELSPGTHWLTATATDAAGGEATHSIAITVE